MGKSQIDTLRDAAVAAFDARHRASYGCEPEALHAWIDAGAILIVARARAATAPAAGCSFAASLAELQDAVVAEVYLRTGVLLRPGGRSANSDRGLLVLAFERASARSLCAARVTARRKPAAGPAA